MCTHILGVKIGHTAGTFDIKQCISSRRCTTDSDGSNVADGSVVQCDTANRTAAASGNRCECWVATSGEVLRQIKAQCSTQCYRSRTGKSIAAKIRGN